MARTRLLHPEQATDDDLLTVSLAARHVFTFLPCHADREGRLRDKPIALKLAILPLDDVDMNKLLQELHDIGVIIRYEVAGRRYIQIRSFLRHQRPHRNEVASDIPPFPGESSAPTPTDSCQGASARDITRALGTLREDSLPSGDDPDPDPDKSSLSRAIPGVRATEPEPGVESGEWDLTAPEPARVTGYQLQEMFAAARSAAFPDSLPWSSRPRDSKNQAGSFADSLDADAAADVQATMALFYRRIVDGTERRAEEFARSPQLAFVAWMHAFTGLREELHGKAPKVKAAPARASPDGNRPRSASQPEPDAWRYPKL